MKILFLRLITVPKKNNSGDVSTRKTHAILIMKTSNFCLHQFHSTIPKKKRRIDEFTTDQNMKQVIEENTNILDTISEITVKLWPGDFIEVAKGKNMIDRIAKFKKDNIRF